MTHTGTDEGHFSLLLASARYGTHINLTSAQFRLSEDQVPKRVVEDFGSENETTTKIGC
jgi:hypothetical protein